MPIIYFSLIKKSRNQKCPEINSFRCVAKAREPEEPCNHIADWTHILAIEITERSRVNKSACVLYVNHLPHYSRKQPTQP